MAHLKDALALRVQSSYKQLSEVATSLNAVSDKLGESIAKLDVALKGLGLGVSSWVSFYTSESSDGQYYTTRELGFTKLGGKWGLAIRTSSGHISGEDEKVEEWPFNEAPRLLRIQSVEKIPDLLDALIKDAAEISNSVLRGVATVDILADAISSTGEKSAEEPW